MAVTAEKIEECLDKLSIFMSRSPDPEAYLPLWRRLKLELERRCEIEAMLEEANCRAKRLMARTRDLRRDRPEV